MLVVIVATLLAMASVAHAERDPAFEAGLVAVGVGNEPLPGPMYERPQLVTKDTTTRPTIGAVSTGLGVLSLTAGWVMYVARQEYRLELRGVVGQDVIDGWESRGTWSLWLTGFGAANIVAAEYLLLPESQSVPFLAWIGGVAGIATAAVGAGYLAGGTHCAPLAVRPGADIPLACLNGRADTMFGVELLLSSAPLLNLPLTYLLRRAFAGAPESLTFTGTGLVWKARF